MSTYTCIHTCIDIHTHIETYTYIPRLIHTYLHKYIHACMHACIDTHIHTYPQKLSHEGRRERHPTFVPAEQTFHAVSACGTDVLCSQ